MNNESQIIKTTLINNQILNCEEIEDIEKILPDKIKDQKEQWQHKIKEILDRSGLKKIEFAKKANISRQGLEKWLKGSIPKNRETFLRLGLIAGYDRKNMDRLLQRYGKYPGLYSKSLEDCVCLFVIEHDYGDKAIEQYDSIMERIVLENSFEEVDIETEMFDKKVSDLENLDELEKFIKESSNIFATQYNRLYSFIIINLRENYDLENNNINILSQQWKWSASLTDSIYKIFNKKWYPTRNKIISLGMHFLMDHEQIDDMLKLAHMEPLCAKNLFESVIIFILEDGSLKNKLNIEKGDYVIDEFFEYVREMLGKIDNEEVRNFMAEFMEI